MADRASVNHLVDVSCSKIGHNARHLILKRQ